ncbi:MAG: hypothetical protein ACRC41_15285 [Sarcina sp.]
MEETIKAPTAIFVGRIDNIMYVNLAHEKGFTEDTKIDVTDEFFTELKTDVVYNSTKYDEFNRTLKIAVPSAKLNDNYFIKLTDADLTETTVTIDTTVEPDALITNNVNVTAYGDRIIEILFDEPVQNLRSSFDFAIDRLNSSSTILKDVYINPVGNNSSYAGKKILECTIQPAIYKFAIETETNTYLEVNSSGEVTGNTITNLTDISPVKGTGVTNYYTLTTPTSVTHSKSDSIKTTGIVLYSSPFSLSETASSVLINFYFRYFGSDDEGTLYAPTTTPLDWLGYFASKDTEIHVSDDNRRFEIEFSKYSLPTGDTHELIINYAKTFPGYTNKSRIKDATGNNFPIVSKTVPILKDAKKATVVSIKSLSRTDFEITFDKPILCLGHETRDFELMLNDKDLEFVSRTDINFNKLIGKFKLQDALDLGPTEITVGSITDACGYKTNEQTLPVTVIADPPRVINLINKEPTAKDTTLLAIEFDTEMADPQKPIEEYISILEVNSETGTETPITSKLFYTLNTPSNTAELLIKDPQLYYGRKYRINIKDFTNKIGTVMIPYSEVLSIGDLTAPVIESIVLTNDDEYSNTTDKQFRHKAVITYNEPMETNGLYSILSSSNYMILGNADSIDWCIENNKKLALNSTLAKVSVPSYEKNNEDRRVIIKLDTDVLAENFDTEADYINYFFGKNKHVVSPGYCDIKTVKYVTNDSGNVLNFSCLKNSIVATKISIGDLSATDALKVIDSETLTLKFTITAANNAIMSISPSDFKIRKTIDGKDVDTIALDAKISADIQDPNNYTIILKFAPNVLVPNTSLILTTGKTSDIFDNPVIFNSTAIPTNILDRVDLVSAEIVNTSGHFAIIKMTFDNFVKVANIPSITPPATPDQLATLATALEIAAHCFAVKLGNKDWISLETILADGDGAPVTPDNLAKINNVSELYFAYDNGSAIFDGTTALLVTTSSQAKMKILAVSNEEPIQVIPQEKAIDIVWNN